MTMFNFLDLFAGAGGLSEGFIRAGFTPIAHVEADLAACNTLKTRMVYHWLINQGMPGEYCKYLCGNISRAQFYNLVPSMQIAAVINAEIGEKTLQSIFSRIDELLNGRRLDLIIGGPPCQAYSLVGRSRDKNRMLGDKRNYLYVFYAHFLTRYKPLYFVFENVTGLLSATDADGKLHFDKMRMLFKDTGYETEYKVLSADEHGVLQRRKRVILIGRKGGKTGFYPELDKWNPEVRVREILRDLPALKSGGGSARPCNLKKYSGEYLLKAGIRSDIPVTWHLARPNTEQDLEIYRIAVQKWNDKKKRLNYNDLPKRLKTHENRISFVDRFKVVSANLPAAHTVVAHISKDGHYYIHPDIRQNRSLSPREAARLQTFPDDFFFEGVTERPARTAAFKQIGNAVPILLAQGIAQKLRKIW